MRALRFPEDEVLLDAFYRDVYLPEFAHQREPLETWKARLSGGPYDFAILIEGEVDGAIAFERYRASGCGFLTYVAVAPHARGRGLGRALVDAARAHLADARLVLGEIHDPDKGGDPDRLARFRRWGARVVELRYVQPDLGFGRDRDLLLVAFSDAPSVDGARVREFLAELYAITEGDQPPDDELRTLLDACTGPLALR